MKQFLLAFFWLNVSVVAIAAQSNPEQAAKNARDQFLDIKNRSLELERVKRASNQKIGDSNPIGNFPQIKEDFETIQKINSDVLRPNLAQETFDRAKISKSANEINRRARRLKANLFPVASEDQEKTENKKQSVGKTESLEILLQSLDKFINSFVHNSIFQNTKIVNPDDSQKAQNDLETLIKLSSQIKSKMLQTVKSETRN